LNGSGDEVVSEEYNEYRARDEAERKIDSDFLACSRYYAEIKEVNDIRSVGVGEKSSEIQREEYAEFVGSVDTLRDLFQSPIPGVMHQTIMYPSAEAYMQDSRQAIEQFKLLPLSEFGPLVDKTFPLDRAQEWYEYAVAMITSRDEFHGDSCVTVTRRDSPQSCRHSLECPRKALRLALMASALMPDFNDPTYYVEPNRQNELVARKLDVAAKAGIEQRHRAYAVLGGYRRMANFALGHS
jgi:hypothetical protein